MKHLEPKQIQTFSDLYLRGCISVDVRSEHVCHHFFRVERSEKKMFSNVFESRFHGDTRKEDICIVFALDASTMTDTILFIVLIGQR